MSFPHFEIFCFDPIVENTSSQQELLCKRSQFVRLSCLLLVEELNTSYQGGTCISFERFGDETLQATYTKIEDV